MPLNLHSVISVFEITLSYSLDVPGRHVHRGNHPQLLAYLECVTQSPFI